MLRLRDSQCHLGKFSNNLDKHGDFDYTAFDVPVDLELSATELNALVQDDSFYRRVFDTDPQPGQPIAPSVGFTRFMPFRLREEFDDVHVELVLDGKALEFDSCRISKMAIEYGLSGNTECHFSLHLKPANDREILTLLHHQRQEARISVSGGKTVFSKRQQDLALVTAKPEGGSDEQQPPPKGDGPSNVLPIR